MPFVKCVFYTVCFDTDQFTDVYVFFTDTFDYIYTVSDFQTDLLPHNAFIDTSYTFDGVTDGPRKKPPR